MYLIIISFNIRLLSVRCIVKSYYLLLCKLSIERLWLLMKPMLNFIWLIDSYSGVQCVHRLVGRGHICQSQCHQEGVACVTKRCPLLVSSTTCDRLKRRGPRQVDSRQLLNRGPQNSCKQSNTEHTSLDLFSVLYKYEDCPTEAQSVETEFDFFKIIKVWSKSSM